MMSSLNIGIDTDGVLLVFWNDIISRALKYFNKINDNITIDGYTINDILMFDQKRCEEYLVKYIDEYCNVTNEKINILEFDIKKIFDCSDYEHQMFWIKNIFDYCMHSKFMDDAIYMIKKLRSEGKKVYNITSREFVTKYGLIGFIFRYVLNKRYKDEGLVFDGIYYCSDKEKQNSKAIVCNALQIDIMIDDFSENVQLISNDRQVLCYDAPHNKKCIGKNIKRVFNMIEIDEYIKKFESDRNKQLVSNDYCLSNKFEEDNLSKIELIEYYKQRKEYYRNLYNDNLKNESSNLLKIKFNNFNSVNILNKEMLPYQNKIGEIFVTNESNFKRKVAIASSIRHRSIYLLDNPGEIEAFIHLVSNGESILINEYYASYIAQVTGSPIIPLISSEKGVIIGDLIYIRPCDDLKEADEKIFSILSGYFYKEETLRLKK